jgi:ABC-type polysaccharide/polyol phosphate transport system ATPase subunit
LRQSARNPVVALEDVSFEVAPGEAFGLLGLNGAGKTTALKLATRISYPSSGHIRVRGRVGALIEVGNGMHPELTGRENIRLYGRILGLSRRQIASRFDDIVEFAEMAHAIDRPVKQYSSGMQLRLGFSVAAHLEPDVFMVDEAIAVGDAGFQYKCVERMTALVKEGRTLIFVSHDMSAMEMLCDRAVLLDAGRIVFDGPARDAVRQYLLNVHANQMDPDASGSIEGDILAVDAVTLHDRLGHEITEIRSGDQLTVRVHYTARHPIRRPIFTIGLHDGRRGALAIATMLEGGGAPDEISGRGYVDCTFKEVPLRARTYEVWGSVRHEVGFGDLVDWQRLRMFRVVAPDESLGAISFQLARAPLILPFDWSFSGAPEVESARTE